MKKVDRIRVKRSKRSAILPSIASLALVGSALGIYLGKSAIAQIDPVYFSTPFSVAKFHADLTPSPPSFEAAPIMFQDASTIGGLGTGCVGCQNRPAEFATYDWPAEASVLPQNVKTGSAEMFQVPLDETLDAKREAARASIERYAYYRVDASDEDRPKVVQAAAEEVEVTPEAADCTIETQCEGDPTPGI